MTTRLVISNIGQQLDLEFKQGCDFEIDIELTNDDDTPLDTSLYDAVANLRKKAFATVITPFVCTFPVPGTMRVAMARAITAGLTCGAELEDDSSTYVWDCELVAKSGGTKTPAFYGDVNLFRDI